MNDEPAHELAQRMAELARQIAPPSSVEEVLSGVTAAAVDMIPAADLAGVLLLSKGGKFESRAVTSDLMHKLDQLQMECGEGPCLEAAVDEMMVRANDFESEPRWPRYSRAILQHGIRSAVSFKLYTGARSAGALNMFAFKPNAFTSESEAIGSVLAAHAASAIVASRRTEQLDSALLSRDLIGQAKGIIMERFKIDAMAAFELLRRLSQTSNTRLVDVAQQVVDTR